MLFIFYFLLQICSDTNIPRLPAGPVAVYSSQMSFQLNSRAQNQSGVYLQLQTEKHQFCMAETLPNAHVIFMRSLCQRLSRGYLRKVVSVHKTADPILPEERACRPLRLLQSHQDQVIQVPLQGHLCPASLLHLLKLLRKANSYFEDSQRLEKLFLRIPRLHWKFMLVCCKGTGKSTKS